MSDDALHWVDEASACPQSAFQRTLTGESGSSNEPDFSSSPWDREWWASVLRDLHNVLPDEFYDDQKPGFNYPGFCRDTEADADLIAAAPDLYKALAKAVQHQDPLVCSQWIGQATAALAKARGKAR